MSKASIRKMFPGAVTYQGFFSYYNYMINPDAIHIYVIKGGPGVGKSTFMKKIAEAMVGFGYDVEYHCCSSDNNSIDGIVIPKLQIALLDGTAPHVVDPKNPGAVDEIINLGDYWDEEKIRAFKPEIINCNYQIGRCFQLAYLALKEAKVALDEWEFYVSECQDWNYVSQMLFKVEKSLFDSIPLPGAKERHLFAWGNTPQGRVQFMDTLISNVKSLYTLSGQPGTGKSTFLSKIAERAMFYGYSVEFFHNTLDPNKLDLVIIPELETALVITAEPYMYKPNFSGNLIELNFDTGLAKLIDSYNNEISNSRERVYESLDRAIYNSSNAKKLHDKLETYYIPAMNFTAINQKRSEILQEILSKAKPEAKAVTCDGLSNPDSCI